MVASFIFNAPGLPKSQAELARMRALILGMQPQGNAPKNVGEGLSYFGKSIGAALMDRQLAKDEKASADFNADRKKTLYENMDDLLGWNRDPDPYAGAASAPSSGPAIAPQPVAGTMENARAADRTSVAGYAGPQFTPASGTFDQMAPRIMADLSRDLGLTPEQAAGVVGNLGVETGGFKHMQELNPIVPGSKGGYGWAQWTGPRRRQFEAWAAQNGLDPNSYEANYGFLKHELTATPEGKVLADLRGAQDPASAASVFEQQFLRPGIPHSDRRAQYAQQALALFGQGQQPGAMQAVNAMAEPATVAGPNPDLTTPPAPNSIGPQGATYSPFADPMSSQFLPIPKADERQRANAKAILMEALTSPYADESTKALAQTIMQQQIEARQPQKPIEVNGRLVDPSTYQVIADFSDSPKPTTSMQEYQFAVDQGYKGTFQDYEKEMKAAGATRVDARNMGNIPPGYRLVEGPNGASMEPIPGSPAALEMEMAQKQREMRTDQKETAANVVVQDIDRALDIVGKNETLTTGVFGNMLSGVGGTDANAVANLMNTVKANAGFDKLQAMREASPTGGALGAVSDTELRLLNAAIGSLEQSQDADQLQDNMRRVKNIYLDIIHGPGKGPARERLTFEKQPPAAETPPPAGIDPDLWGVMTPEERALWN